MEGFASGRSRSRGKQWTRRKARRTFIEPLEARLLLTGNNVFAQAEGSLLASNTAPVIQFSLDNNAFALSGDETILNFHVQPIAGSELDPAAVVIRDEMGQQIEAIVAEDDTGGGINSVGVFSLSAGTYTVAVPGENGSVGGFNLTVGLVGDVDGDGDVQSDDREAVRDLRQNVQYQLEADADFDGLVTAFDYAMTRRNLGDSTSHMVLNRPPIADNETYSTDTFETLITGSVLDGRFRSRFLQCDLRRWP